MMKRLMALVMAFSAGALSAQDYPTRTVRIIVPYPAGGPTDILSRGIAPLLSSALGQPVIVDNRAGASGMIGSELAARSPPDGHTLLWGTSGSHAINPALHPKMPYDPLKDFVGITLVGQGTNVLVVHPSVPARSIKELVALAKAQPGKLSFSSSGNGSTSHLAGEMLKSLAAIDMVHIPFKGATPAIVGLLSGQADLAVLDLPGILAHIRADRLRPLGVARTTRSAVLPQVPTMIEFGLKDYEASSWHALYAPAGTPPAIVRRLNTEVVRIVRQPEMQKRLSAQGVDPIGSTPEQFETFLRAELARWAKVVKASGARVD